MTLGNDRAGAGLRVDDSLAEKLVDAPVTASHPRNLPALHAGRFLPFMPPC
ncbi:hypothetical protein LY15_000566 [Prauserella flava]|uniref:Uncharacterized protein n=1 Tax=Prauserella sediminis TaxID=577680 RepID=A0A839XZI9_9PSEU|nr:hypothetical protein [Prauserella sediminis]MCR3718605.1 hypothetical protein [Prauserella flava]MCR3733175.1 hypothetical protein [Prauserella salsuginis]